MSMVFVLFLVLAALVIGVLWDDDVPACQRAPSHLPSLGAARQYTGDVKITGSATLDFSGNGSVNIHYDLAGVESACNTASTDDNSCGIHIHAGSGCEDGTAQGGHFYDSETIAQDPWATVTYSGGISDTSAVGSVTVTNGYSAKDTFSHVFIVHDRSGDRVTCIPITSPCTFP
jgi:hypothetical protein